MPLIVVVNLPQSAAAKDRGIQDIDRFIVEAFKDAPDRFALGSMIELDGTASRWVSLAGRRGYRRHRLGLQRMTRRHCHRSTAGD